jgi:hypothetical protein
VQNKPEHGEKTQAHTGELLWPPPLVADGEDVENPMGLGTLKALFDHR